jgi:hypothetical protein
MKGIGALDFLERVLKLQFLDLSTDPGGVEFE